MELVKSDVEEGLERHSKALGIEIRDTVSPLALDLNTHLYYCIARSIIWDNRSIYRVNDLDSLMYISVAVAVMVEESISRKLDKNAALNSSLLFCLTNLEDFPTSTFMYKYRDLTGLIDYMVSECKLV